MIYNTSDHCGNMQVKYVMRCAFKDTKKAPPPIEKLSAEGMVSVLWKGEGSLVDDLLHSMAPHVEPNVLSDLKSKIQVHDPSGSDNIESAIRKSLLWQVFMCDPIVFLITLVCLYSY